MSIKSDIGFPASAPQSLVADKGSSTSLTVVPLADGEVTLYCRYCSYERRCSLLNRTAGTSNTTPFDGTNTTAETITLSFKTGDTIIISINNGYGYASAVAELTWNYSN